MGARALVIALVVAAAVIGAAVFVGCGGIGVRMADDIGIEPVSLAEPVKVDGPITLDALRIDETVPIAIQGSVPVALAGPITIQLEGPSVEYEGTYVSEALIERIQLGTTGADWILAVVGEPQSRTTLDDGSEIWKWVYRPTGSQQSLVSLLGQDEEKPQPQPITAFVRLKDGLVIDKWRG
jgi:hypothetical protein